MKKKIIAIALCMSLMGTVLVGCSSSSSGDSSSSTQSSSYEEVEYTAQDYVTLGEYKGIEITLNKADYEVTDADVEEEIESQVQSYPQYTKTDKKTVKKKSVVNIDYVGKIDGEAFDGGTASDTYIDIAEDESSYIDGFVSGIIGHNVGETFDVNVTFPEDYSSEDLAGKDAVFTMTINAIVKKSYPTMDELTDDYVSENFSYDTVDEYVESVESSLKETASTNKTNDISSKVVETIVSNAEVSGMPAGLLESRVAQYKEQYEDMAEQYGYTLEEYLQNSYGMTEEEFDSEIETSMKENVEEEMILKAIAEEEKIEVDEDGFNSYVENIVSSYGYEDADALYAEFSEDYIKSVYLVNEVREFVVDNAVVNYTTEDAEDESSAQ